MENEVKSYQIGRYMYLRQNSDHSCIYGVYGS